VKLEWERVRMRAEGVPDDNGATPRGSGHGTRVAGIKRAHAFPDSHLAWDR
ncbi:hypothetical protein COCCADRAFT_92741, partial [Bipolaris zeicola 26-R-13]